MNLVLIALESIKLRYLGTPRVAMTCLQMLTNSFGVGINSFWWGTFLVI